VSVLVFAVIIFVLEIIITIKFRNKYIEYLAIT